MPRTPGLERDRSTPAGCDGSIVLAVYAPFGSDENLSVLPKKTQAPIDQQEIVKQLHRVAEQGINVSALVDLFEDDTWLVEMAAGKKPAVGICSAWKQDMSRPQALAGFLRRVHARFPKSHIVLSLEGHGAGYLPELDFARLGHDDQTETKAGEQLRWTQSPEGTTVEPADGAPTLPADYRILPPTTPGFPASHLPLSSWAVSAALKSAIQCGVPRPVIVNFANCFNASVEHLHGIAKLAGYATGYANYNYFTAGITYPEVFRRFIAGGTGSAADLAALFVTVNGELLDHKGHHPLVGAMVPLARFGAISRAVDRLARELVDAMRANGTVRLDIRDVAAGALQYDTDQDYDLEVPDQTIDLGGFARALLNAPQFATRTDVLKAAKDVLKAIDGLHRHGSDDDPYMNRGNRWNFSDPDLALSLFFPDPRLEGLWDWRSPFYMAGEVKPDEPPALRAQIDFLRNRPGGRRAPWAEFIEVYHEGVKFTRFLPVKELVFPKFDARYDPKKDQTPNPDNPDVPGKPGQTPPPQNDKAR